MGGCADPSLARCARTLRTSRDVTPVGRSAPARRSRRTASASGCTQIRAVTATTRREGSCPLLADPDCPVRGCQPLLRASSGPSRHFQHTTPAANPPGPNGPGPHHNLRGEGHHDHGRIASGGLVERNHARVLWAAVSSDPKLADPRWLNWRKPPRVAAAIDTVVVTHTCLDHGAYLPRPVRHGSRGWIVTTEYSAHLIEIVLRDSARLWAETARRANEHGWSKHRPVRQLYDDGDVDRPLRLLDPARSARAPRSHRSHAEPYRCRAALRSARARPVTERAGRSSVREGPPGGRPEVGRLRRARGPGVPGHLYPLHDRHILDPRTGSAADARPLLAQEPSLPSGPHVPAPPFVEVLWQEPQ